MLCNRHDRDAPSRSELLLPGLGPAIQSRFPDFLELSPKARDRLSFALPLPFEE
jgi:hypothetical protein